MIRLQSGRESIKVGFKHYNPSPSEIREIKEYNANLKPEEKSQKKDLPYTECFVYRGDSDEVVASHRCYLAKGDTFVKELGRKFSFARVLEQLYPRDVRKGFWASYHSRTKKNPVKL